MLNEETTSKRRVQRSHLLFFCFVFYCITASIILQPASSLRCIVSQTSLAC